MGFMYIRMIPVVDGTAREMPLTAGPVSCTGKTVGAQKEAGDGLSDTCCYGRNTYHTKS